MDLRPTWQLAVVDYGFMDVCDCPRLQRTLHEMKQSTNPNNIKQGTVVYIVDTFRMQVTDLLQDLQELSDRPTYKAYGIPFAEVWVPSLHKYGRVMLQLLHPIISEEDAINVETELGTSLKGYA